MQRLAHLEGVIHWINHAPRLVLMLMPLSYGLLQIQPIHRSLHAVVNLLLPLWATLLMTVRWLNRGSRTALLGELTSWVMTVPLTLTLLRSLDPASGAFRITPKHSTRTTWRLTFPLASLMLLGGLNLINLSLLTQLPDHRPGIQDRPGLGIAQSDQHLDRDSGLLGPSGTDPTHGFSCIKADLIDPSGQVYPCRITAISEQGVELQWPGAAPSEVNACRLRLNGLDELLEVSAIQRAQTQAVLAWTNVGPSQRRP